MNKAKILSWTVFLKLKKTNNFITHAGDVEITLFAPSRSIFFSDPSSIVSFQCESYQKHTKQIDWKKA